MKMIFAVIRSGKVDSVARELKHAGIAGCTVYPVRGYGEEWHLYEPLVHGGHHQLEATVEDDQVEKAVEAITKHAATGLEGHGVVSVLDLKSFMKIRVTWNSNLESRKKTLRRAA